MTAGAMRWWAVVCVVVASAAAAQEAVEADDATGRFGFAVMADAGAGRDGAATLQAIDAAPVRFVVQFDRSTPSPASCGDDALDRRRRLLDASAKPVVPVVSAAEWADCGTDAPDAADRLARVGDALFADDRSPGRASLRWVRQSATSRGRGRENVRWQVGRVLFATVNLPNDNNAYRAGAGRNGEFEERALANRAWLERTFRIARERRVVGVVLFFDAAPRFGASLKTPDPSNRERDGYYEWKVALREQASTFKGRILLVQGHAPAGAGMPLEAHPLHDAAGRVLTHVTRVALADADGSRWWRVDVDAAAPQPFTIVPQRLFDDPSGELYGSGPTP